MLNPDQINTIHRLHGVGKWSLRKIAAHLHISRRTIVKYLETPAPPPTRRDRASKLDPFKTVVSELLATSKVDAPVSSVRSHAEGDFGLPVRFFRHRNSAFAPPLIHCSDSR